MGMRTVVAAGTALSVAMLLTGCSAAASSSEPTAAPVTQTPTASTGPQANTGDGSVRMVAVGPGCPITVTVTRAGAATSTRYALGDAVAVRIGDRLAVASRDRCAPDLHAQTEPRGPLSPVGDLPATFTAVSAGSAHLVVTLAMCDGLRVAGCRGGLSRSIQAVEVARASA
jgi:hypothetical protein